MKRFICLVFLLILLPICAIAEFSPALPLYTTYVADAVEEPYNWLTVSGEVPGLFALYVGIDIARTYSEFTVDLSKSDPVYFGVSDIDGEIAYFFAYAAKSNARRKTYSVAYYVKSTNSLFWDKEWRIGQVETINMMKGTCVSYTTISKMSMNKALQLFREQIAESVKESEYLPSIDFISK